MTTKLIKYTFGLFFTAFLTTGTAQSTFNYDITPAGSTTSLVTWNATGSLIGSPGVQWESQQGEGAFVGLPILTRGLFIAGYAGMLSPLLTPDGSYFYNTELGQSFAINGFTAVAGGRDIDIFGLWTPPATTTSGQHLTYTAGSQSVIIPAPYSDFNPGTYQSIFAAGTFFDSEVTVNLTVGAVPEPYTLALFAEGGLGALLCVYRRKRNKR